VNLFQVSGRSLLMLLVWVFLFCSSLVVAVAVVV
jgi:hypothetical protein